MLNDIPETDEQLDEYARPFFNYPRLDHAKTQKIIKKLAADILNLNIESFTVFPDPQAYSNACRASQLEELTIFEYDRVYLYIYYQFVQSKIELDIDDTAEGKTFLKLYENYKHFPFAVYYDKENKKIVYIDNPIRNDESSMEGPAILWESGYGQYYIKNQHFTEKEFEQLILNDPTFAQILSIDNADKRTTVLELKRHVLLNDPKLKILDEITQFAKPLKKNVPARLCSTQIDDVELRFLELYCHSTERIAIIIVEADHSTVKESLKWVNKGIEIVEES